MKRAISDEMKRFADEKLLDGMVPDRFEEAVQFSGAVEQIEGTLGMLSQEDQSNGDE